MTAVVLFSHGGFDCAVPASQARAVDTRGLDAPLVPLFGEHSTPYSRALELCTTQGPVYVGCGAPRLFNFPAEEALALTPVLRGALRLVPHVVGLATLEGRNTLLVDLDRFARPGQQVSQPS